MGMFGKGKKAAAEALQKLPPVDLQALKQQALSQVQNFEIPNLQELKENKGEARRVALWAFWTLNLLINIIFMGMTFATSSRLAGVKFDIQAAISNHTWGAPIAAATLGGLMVLVFDIMSCVILVRKTINTSGPGFGYGFIMAWCFVMSFYLLLCGLVLDAFADTIENDVQATTSWGGYYTQIYKATIIFSWICAGMFMLFFLALVIFQGGISKAIGMFDANTDEKRKLELAAMARAAQANINPLAATPGVL